MADKPYCLTVFKKRFPKEEYVDYGPEALLNLTVEEAKDPFGKFPETEKMFRSDDAGALAELGRHPGSIKYVWDEKGTSILEVTVYGVRPYTGVGVREFGIVTDERPGLVVRSAKGYEIPDALAPANLHDALKTVDGWITDRLDFCNGYEIFNPESYGEEACGIYEPGPEGGLLAERRITAAPLEEEEGLESEFLSGCIDCFEYGWYAPWEFTDAGKALILREAADTSKAEDFGHAALEHALGTLKRAREEIDAAAAALEKYL